MGGHTERAKTLTWMSQSLGAAAGIGRGNGQTRLLVRLSRENSNSRGVAVVGMCPESGRDQINNDEIKVH